MPVQIDNGLSRNFEIVCQVYIMRIGFFVVIFYAAKFSRIPFPSVEMFQAYRLITS